MVDMESDMVYPTNECAWALFVVLYLSEHACSAANLLHLRMQRGLGCLLIALHLGIPCYQLRICPQIR